MPPRLIAAERDGRLLLLLPETHAGLRDQYDHYFRAVIMPAFAASSALFSERSSPVQADTQLRYRPCADQQPDEAQVDAALNATLPELLPATYWGVQTPPAPVTGFSRFMRVQMVLEDAYFNSAGWYAPPWQPQPVPDLPSDLTTHYAARLMLDAPRRAVSVDTPDSSFKAYCSLTPAQRTALARAAMQQRLRQAGHAPPRDQLDRPVDAGAVERQDLQDEVAQMDADYRQILKRIAQALERTDLADPIGKVGKIDRNSENDTNDTNDIHGKVGKFANDASDQNQRAIDRYLLGARNRVWVAQLPQMTAGQRLPFMVLGAAHFLDADADSGPGLLRLLRDDGYRLTLVQDRRQLAVLLRKLPPPPAQASPG
ncbi:hypothetical protein ASF61_07795 [Duganella sp. Leaf126]|nr:hypothetical protein ASF61_07795 [Duganella sp. Leaf126]